MPVEPGAKFHQGRVLVVWDHGGLQVRDQSGEVLYVSLYDYRFDLADGPGRVAVFRYRGDGDAVAAIDLTLTDNQALGDSHWSRRSRLRGLSAGAVVPARITREEARDQFNYRIDTRGLLVEVEWRRLGPPIFMTGVHPQDAEIDVFGQVREAAEHIARVNGVEVQGESYPNEAYTPWLGQPLHSASVTIGEVLIEQAGTAAGSRWNPTLQIPGMETTP